MKIIIDTREQLPLSFTGHETISRKLDEGDYNIEELEDYIVIERKSYDDLYSSITHWHIRFKSEIKRAILKKKDFYIALEGNLQEFYTLKWTPRKLESKPETIQKIINTMRERYALIFIESNNREELSKKILEVFENEKKLKRR
jgi:ERCC4-type nuclease